MPITIGISRCRLHVGREGGQALFQLLDLIRQIADTAASDVLLVGVVLFQEVQVLQLGVGLIVGDSATNLPWRYWANSGG